jgi:hypothetical protein
MSPVVSSKVGVQRSGGSVSTVACPNSEFLSQDLKGKHSWLNACSAKELSERVRHVLSACVASFFNYLCLCSHKAVNAYRHVSVKKNSVCFDCAERRSCPLAARRWLLVSSAKS